MTLSQAPEDVEQAHVARQVALLGGWDEAARLRFIEDRLKGPLPPDERAAYRREYLDLTDKPRRSAA